MRSLPVLRERVNTNSPSEFVDSLGIPDPIPVQLAYIPTEPTAKQAEFLALTCREAFYGGAAGGGKSEALLMGALQYVHVPGYAALILRRTYQDLAKPGAIMDRAKEWLLPHKDVHWSGDTKTFTFPSGAKLSFGYLQHENDKYQYQSSEFQYIAFDELTQFLETQYTYLFSRLRRKAGLDVPLRMRSASNPGGVGHEWVKARFINPGDPRRVFIPATLDDNPHIEREEYIQSLGELDEVTQARLQSGNWDVRDAGEKFKREWFVMVEPEDVPTDMRCVRSWDLAGTKPSKVNPDPDWTRGVLMGRSSDGIYYVLDGASIRAQDYEVEKLVKRTAHRDGNTVTINIEQEPGSSGKAIISNYRRKVLDGYMVRSNRPTGTKWDRATPFAIRAAAGDVKIVRGAWNMSFLNELDAFSPNGQHAHDDWVDAACSAYTILSGGPSDDDVEIIRFTLGAQ